MAKTLKIEIEIAFLSKNLPKLNTKIMTKKVIILQSTISQKKWPKKLVLVLVISALVTSSYKKDITLECILYLY